VGSGVRRSPLRDYFAPKPHPQTGDMLKFGERVTWLIMGIYRRWTVFLGLQALALSWLLKPSWFPGGRPGWNYLWSDLAIIVEMMVGIAFLSQSMRDARIIRQELAELKEMHAELRQLLERK
jgi:hypothetical protein